MPRKATLLRVAASNVGALQAYRTIAFMVQWAIAREALGLDALTVAEYAEWWRYEIRTAYREQARFREAFPGERNPDRLLDAVRSEWSARDGVSGLASRSLPRLAA